MRRLLFPVLSLGLSILSFETHANELQSMYDRCVLKVSGGGYESSLQERACNDWFDLPSAFLIKCLRWQAQASFPAELDQLACRYLCESNQNWGPWYDFAIPFELREGFHQMKALHKSNRCLTSD